MIAQPLAAQRLVWSTWFMLFGLAGVAARCSKCHGAAHQQHLDDGLEQMAADLICSKGEVWGRERLRNCLNNLNGCYPLLFVCQR